jgi:hypothetical protein
VSTPSVVEQKEPIKSCLRFDQLIVLDPLSSPAAKASVEGGGAPPVAAAAAAAACEAGMDAAAACEAGVDAAAACEAEACGPASASATRRQLRLRRLGGSTMRGA